MFEKRCEDCLKFRADTGHGKTECVEAHVFGGYALELRHFIRPESTAEAPCPAWEAIPKKANADDIPSYNPRDLNWLFAQKDENRKPPRQRRNV